MQDMEFLGFGLQIRVSALFGWIISRHGMLDNHGYKLGRQWWAGVLANLVDGVGGMGPFFPPSFGGGLPPEVILASSKGGSVVRLRELSEGLYSGRITPFVGQEFYLGRHGRQTPIQLLIPGIRSR